LDKEKKAQLERLWPFLLVEPLRLTEEEIKDILGAKELLENHLRSISGGFPSSWERALRHHKKKEELSKLSTEELKAMDREINKDREAFFRSVDAREEAGEDVGDSAFEGPPVDSDEHIVYELLKERETSEIRMSSASGKPAISEDTE
jgi:hypothetical protein